jgi:hypothetical protein
LKKRAAIILQEVEKGERALDAWMAGQVEPGLNREAVWYREDSKPEARYSNSSTHSCT